MSEVKSNESFQYESFFDNSKGSINLKNQPYQFYCNVWSCYKCHENQQRLTPEEIYKIRQKRNNNNFQPKPKRCDGNCNYCMNKINSINQY